MGFASRLRQLEANLQQRNQAAENNRELVEEQARIREETRVLMLLKSAKVVAVEVSHEPHQHDCERIKGESYFTTREYASLYVYVRLAGIDKEQLLKVIRGLNTSRIAKKIALTQSLIQSCVVGKTISEARVELDLISFTDVQRSW